MIRCAVLVASDRASRGDYEDMTGPRLAAALAVRGWLVQELAVVPDDERLIRGTVRDWIDQGVGLIVAAGGTGVTPRDVTPEALKPLLDKELPGFGELMRAEGLKKTPKAALSRSFAGTAGGSLILGVPGSPRGAAESLSAVAGLVPSVLSLLQEGVCA